MEDTLMITIWGFLGLRAAGHWNARCTKVARALQSASRADWVQAIRPVVTFRTWERWESTLRHAALLLPSNATCHNYYVALASARLVPHLVPRLTEAIQATVNEQWPTKYSLPRAWPDLELGHDLVNDWEDWAAASSMAPNLVAPTFVELIEAMLQTAVGQWPVELPTSADGQ